ncbi:MAG: hypothetical protein NC489_22675, partial [Ruminococcus flavefaciens]|nr:hypothetical protein [Ruminococcus flavefaciens]
YASEISPEDDNYTEKLIEVMQSFLETNEALDAFLVSRGYDGDPTDEKKKIAFIKMHLHEAGIAKPSNRNAWFDNKIGRLPAVQLCFAFGLNLQESQEFFRKVCLDRGLDCHNIEEAIYYYCLKNGLGYGKAEKLIERVSRVPQKEGIDLSGNILYTGSIIQELERISSEDELVSFFEKNIRQFAYNNATAWRKIKDIWETIAKIDGLADQESECLFIHDYAKADAYVVSGDKDKHAKRSTWGIYKQILGIDDDFQEGKNGGERTIKPILKDNPLIHSLAEKEFPNRQNIEHILNGNTKSSEGIRKTLILLLFYKFWVKSALDQKSGSYKYKREDHEDERCLDQMNQHLIEAGYPTLYYGNPYDWIFLYAIRDEYPLETFRYFIRELHLYKQKESQ